MKKKKKKTQAMLEFFKIQGRLEFYIIDIAGFINFS